MTKPVTVWGSTEYCFGPLPKDNAFAIPILDWRDDPLPVQFILHYVQRFIVYARWHPETTFHVSTLIIDETSLRHEIIAEMFKYAPANCLFNPVWEIFLPKKNFYI